MLKLLVTDNDKELIIEKGKTRRNDLVIWDKNMNCDYETYQNHIHDSGYMEDLIDALRISSEVTFYPLIGFGTYSGCTLVHQLYPESIKHKIHICFATSIKNNETKLLVCNAKRPDEYATLGWHDEYGLQVPVLIYRGEYGLTGLNLK